MSRSVAPGGDETPINRKPPTTHTTTLRFQILSPVLAKSDNPLRVT